MKRLVGSLGIVLAICLAAGPGGVSDASPTHERDYVYYNGCGSSMTQVGEYTYWCTGHHTSSGTQTGDWMEYTEVACATWEVTAYYNYRKCSNGGWQIVPYADFGSCSCSC